MENSLTFNKQTLNSLYSSNYFGGHDSVEEQQTRQAAWIKAMAKLGFKLDESYDRDEWGTAADTALASVLGSENQTSEKTLLDFLYELGVDQWKGRIEMSCAVVHKCSSGFGEYQLGEVGSDSYPDMNVMVDHILSDPESLILCEGLAVHNQNDFTIIKNQEGCFHAFRFEKVRA